MLGEVGVVLALVADGGAGAVARDDDGGVGQGKQLGVDGTEQGGTIAAGKIGATDGASEKSVAGEEKTFVRQVETDAALGVAGGVEDVAGEGWARG